MGFYTLKSFLKLEYARLSHTHLQHIIENKSEKQVDDNVPKVLQQQVKTSKSN